MKWIRYLMLILALVTGMVVIQVGAGQPAIQVSASARAVCGAQFSHELEVSWNVTGAVSAVQVVITVTGPNGQTQAFTLPLAQGSIRVPLNYPGGGSVQVQVVAQTASGSVTGSAIASLTACAPPSQPAKLMWINHFDLLPGDPSVITSFNAISSGVGGGLTGLVIESTTTGDTAPGGGNKVVHRALEVPPGLTITGVRVCYELSNARSFITQIRLAQVQDPPSSAVVLLDDGTDWTNPGPVCVDSQPTSVDPSRGAVLLSLRVNFGDTSDRIVIRALALHVR